MSPETATSKPILKPNANWALVRDPKPIEGHKDLMSAEVVELSMPDARVIGVPVMDTAPMIKPLPGAPQMSGRLVLPARCTYRLNMHRDMPKPIRVPGGEGDWFVPLGSVVAWEWDADALQ